ncbi:MAG: cell division protein ZapA [Pseudoxanthomonas sp.]|nr:cell division protein ZapA [Pseudoxanthomonas sp.]
MSEANTVSVSILDRDYLVACPPDGRDALHAAARLLDGRLRELRRNARSATLERLAIMVALNLAHEQQQARSEADGVAGGIDRELRQLIGRLDAVLADG